MENTFSTLESLPKEKEAYDLFILKYPRYLDSAMVDKIRQEDYSHLDGENSQVCLDYNGVGMFSYAQQVSRSLALRFGLAYISANLATHALYAEDGTLESIIRMRILQHLNVDDREYAVVFTASTFSALKLLGESYPFHSSKKLLMAYDHQNESLDWFKDCAGARGASVVVANRDWPGLQLGETDLRKKLQGKRRKGHFYSFRKKDKVQGLFAYPAVSHVTGVRNSLRWISEAQEHGWHVLLDISGLGVKAVDCLGLSLLRPEFIICSFYKVFASDATGFGCLIIKKTVLSNLGDSSRARAVGMVRIVPRVDSPCSTLESLDMATSSVRSGSLTSSPDALGHFHGVSTEQKRILQHLEHNSYVDSREWNHRKEKQQAEKQPDIEIEVVCTEPVSGKYGYKIDTEKGNELRSCNRALKREPAPMMLAGSTEDQFWRGNVRNVDTLSNHISPKSKPSKELPSLDFDQCLAQYCGCRLFKPGSSGPRKDPGRRSLSFTEPGQEVSYCFKTAGSSLHMEGHEESLSLSTTATPRVTGTESIWMDASLPPREQAVDFECCGLDRVDQVTPTRISSRVKALMNWLISSLSQLRRTNGSSSLVKVYGPLSQADRGSSVAFNIINSCGHPLDVNLVQRLADRSNISLATGFIGEMLQGSSVADNLEQEDDLVKGRTECTGKELRGFSQGCVDLAGQMWMCKGVDESEQLPVMCAALSFLSNFSDVFRLWVFVANFLDSDFVSREQWRYHTLNQKTVVV